MFHIGGLIVFCGLLAQTTAQDQTPSVTPAVAQDSKGLLGSLKSALGNGLVSEDVLNSIKELPLVNFLQNQSSLFGNLPSFLNIVDLEIIDARLMEFGIVPSPDGRRLYATFPLNLVFNMKLPLIGNLLEVNMDLNITAEIMAVTDDAGKARLVVGDCSHSPGGLKITLLNGKAFRFTQAFLNSLTGIFSSVLPALVQSQVCPLVNTLLGQLDITLAHNLANKLIQKSDVVITV
ncbi:BPI fold-containing family A member 1 [Rhinolophus sinicus]|uniref:BPI fold-containing family A member 1 n=1 Tax=Rhinolophus sinicus TaxID=89399 RepID=UPI003D7A8790